MRNDTTFDWSSKIEIQIRKKKKIVLENFDDFEDWRATSWKRSGEGGNKFPSRVSYQAWNKSERFGYRVRVQRGTEGAKRKNEFMERSLDGRTVKERLLSGRFTSRARPSTCCRKRFDDKFNFAELAGGTCKLPRNELCYIVLGVQLEFRRENRVTGAVGTG